MDLTTPPPHDNPADALAAVVALRRLAASIERTAIDEALAQGWTWARIGGALDLSAQAAHKRLSPGKRRPFNDGTG